MNLLTDEQIIEILEEWLGKIRKKTGKYEFPPVKEGSPITDWSIATCEAIAEAQARLTLQEVGEWLEREGLELTWDNSQGFEDVLKWEGTEGRLVFVSKAMIEALKRGEMPEREG